MLYKYKAIDPLNNEEKNGTIEAATVDIAIGALQRRKLIIITIVGADDAPFWEKMISMEKKIAYRDVVILSRQMATLFRAQVSALRVFQLLALEAENELMQKCLTEVAEDIQGGMSLSGALAKHPEVFSDFYSNMVRAGEESGNLSNTFGYLADYLDRTYELIAKTRNALIYPAFVIVVFFLVMTLMLVLVVPKFSAMIAEAGAPVPFYTKVVIGLSNLFVSYGIFVLAGLGVVGFMVWKFLSTTEGKLFLDRMSLSVPYVGDLFRKLYLARIADNLNTMLSSGISMVRAVEIAASVVGNEIFRNILLEIVSDVRTGVPLSSSMAKHEEIPGIMTQMVKIGEETGEVGSILETLAKFYKREVDNAVDTLIGMIEPAMIVMLGVGVGGLVASILMPIYNISSSF